MDPNLISTINQYIYDYTNNIKKEIINKVLQNTDIDGSTKQTVISIINNTGHVISSNTTTTSRNNEDDDKYQTITTCNTTCNTACNTTSRNNLCTALMLSGKRKGLQCGRNITNGNLYCSYHKKKELSQVGSKTIDNISSNTCIAILKSGANAGEICGKTTKPGAIYCGKHIFVKCQGIDMNGNRCERKISLLSLSDSYCDIHIIQELNIDLSTILYVKTPHNNLQHKYTGLIAEHINDKDVIVGTENINGDIIRKLSDNDMEAIFAYKLPVAEYHIESMKNFIRNKNTNISSISAIKFIQQNLQ